MPDLYPAFDIPSGPVEVTDRRHELHSAAFDFETGDFILNQQGRIPYASPMETWKQWCIKVIRTQRFALFGYNKDTGAELEEAFREPTTEAKESALERTITETLLADPYGRTAYVRDFLFAWNADSVTVTFTVGSIWPDTTLVVKL